MGRKDNATRTFRLPNDLLAALDEEAARTGLSRNVVAFQWMCAGLEILKDKETEPTKADASYGLTAAQQAGKAMGPKLVEVTNQSDFVLNEDATTIIYDRVDRTLWVEEKAGALGEAQPATTER